MMILISAVIDLDPERAWDVIEGARPFIEEALAEPGCQAYSWSIDPLVPGRVNVFERWDSEEALASHFRHPCYAAMRQRIMDAKPLKTSNRKYLVSDDAPVYDATGKPSASFATAAAAA